MGALQGARSDRKKELKSGRLPNPSLEAVGDFVDRTLRWWDTTIAELARTTTSQDTTHVLVVSHGAYIATLVHSLIADGIVETGDGGGPGRCFNTSVTTLEMSRLRQWRLVRYSDISHLLKPAVDSVADDLGDGP